MKKGLLISVLLVIILIPMTCKAAVASSSSNRDLNVYVFYDKNCKECEKAKEYIEEKVEENYRINLKYISVEDKKDLFESTKKELGLKNKKYPVIVIGTDSFIGFNNTIKKKVSKAIDNYLDNNNYCDLVYRIDNNQDITKCLEINAGIYADNNTTYKIIAIVGVLVVATSISIVIIKKKLKKKY